MKTVIKKCITCGKEAHSEDDLYLFKKDKRQPLGYRNKCRECINKRKNEVYDGRKKLITETKRKYEFFQKIGRCECESCGIKVTEENTSIFEFHHKDPKQKKFHVSEAIRKKTLSKEIYEEAKKSMVLCGNCHKLEHMRLNKEKFKIKEFKIEFKEI